MSLRRSSVMVHDLFLSLEPVLLPVLALCHVAGILSALDALFTARSSQGSIAWVMSMITFPYFAVPLYWVFGRDRFVGYVAARREGSSEIEALRGAMEPHRVGQCPIVPGVADTCAVLEKLSGMPFTTGNHAELLIDGQATFEAIFQGMDQAQHYVLVQFFIIHDDLLGREFQNKLLATAARGVRVLLLYDEVGSHKLPLDYLETLRAAGVDARPFNTTKGWRNRFQLNFRNHRKIVVVDGHVAFVGGLNVGDAYMGRSARFGPWRDTHLRCQGPSVTMVQLSFLEDWYWAAQKELPDLDWNIQSAPKGGMNVLVLPSGPADVLETYNLAFIQLVQSARKRLWIVSPYFVPGKEVTCALQLAALRGVDVRVMLPLKPDHKLVYLASFYYLAELASLGVKFFRYKPGFLHQKVVLMDDELAFVGTANCDNRSFRLNFEITMAVADREFVREVEAMLIQDFVRCVPATGEDYERRWLGFKAAVQLARLLSPIL